MKKYKFVFVILQNKIKHPNFNDFIELKNTKELWFGEG